MKTQTIQQELKGYVGPTHSEEGHVTYAIRNAIKHPWPFPHFFAENVFSEGFYLGLQEKLAAKTDFSASEFANRTFADSIDMPELDFLRGKQFLNNILGYFRNEVSDRLSHAQKTQVYRDLRLVRDGIGYKIGPHTDAKWKMVSLLFYLPPDDWRRNYGTSIYVPRDPAFTCEGGPHYPFEPFDTVYTAPYIPNSCFGFWKTNNSFHGVEPIPVSFRRDVLLYNIYQKEAFDASHEPKGLS